MDSKRVFGSVSQIPLSPALLAGGMIFVSGQVPTDSAGNIIPGIEAANADCARQDPVSP